MKKFFRVLAILVGIIVILVLGAGFYVKTFLPNVGDAPDLKIASTPERIARGSYLANSVMVCTDCHSTRNWSYYGGPITPGTEGKGGEIFDARAGFPGTIYSRNITPAGLKSWTDGEIFRAITAGVSKDGKALFPVMPHANYGKCDPKDIEDVICYLRALPPIDNAVPASEYDFPVNFIINTIPAKPTFTKKPASTNTVAYGKYLITAASCGDCHTPFDKGTYDMSKQYAGGRSFQMPAGVITSANITPDEETGTGKWTKKMFIDKFAMYRDSATSHRQINFAKDMSTIMPWPAYASMTDEDLGAIYDYLKTLKPISNQIVKYVKN